MKKNYKKLIVFILSVILGGFIFIYGGYDDSPGAQLLGLVITFIGLIYFFKKRSSF